MFKTIEGAADCEIRSVIRFLNARNVLSSEIHHQICQVYGDNAMSDGMVRKWVRMFTEGRDKNCSGSSPEVRREHLWLTLFHVRCAPGGNILGSKSIWT